MTPLNSSYFDSMVSAFLVRKPTSNIGEYVLPKTEFADVVDRHNELTILRHYEETRTQVYYMERCEKLSISNKVTPTRTDLTHPSVLEHCSDAFNRGLTYSILHSCEALCDMWSDNEHTFMFLEEQCPEKFADVEETILRITAQVNYMRDDLEKLEDFIDTEFQTRAWSLRDYDGKVMSLVKQLDELLSTGDADRIVTMARELV